MINYNISFHIKKMLEKNGDIGFESYILRLKSGVASIQERGSLGNSVKSIVKAL